MSSLIDILPPAALAGIRHGDDVAMRMLLRRTWRVFARDAQLPPPLRPAAPARIAAA